MRQAYSLRDISASGFVDRGFVGLVFAIVCMIVLFVLTKPDYWQIFAGAVTFGLLIAMALHVLRRPEMQGPPDSHSVNPEYPHPGITMHRIRFGAGFAGFLFTAGCMLIFLFGTPGLWVVVPGTVVLGSLIAVAFRFFPR